MHSGVSGSLRMNAIEISLLFRFCSIRSTRPRKLQPFFTRRPAGNRILNIKNPRTWRGVIRLYGFSLAAGLPVAVREDQIVQVLDLVGTHNVITLLSFSVTYSLPEKMQDYKRRFSQFLQILPKILQQNAQIRGTSCRKRPGQIHLYRSRNSSRQRPLPMMYAAASLPT